MHAFFFIPKSHFENPHLKSMLQLKRQRMLPKLFKFFIVELILQAIFLFIGAYSKHFSAEMIL